MTYVQRIEDTMKCKLDRSLTNARLIRDVGPNKMMTLISFKLTEEMVHRNNLKRNGDMIERECKRNKQ